MSGMIGKFVALGALGALAACSLQGTIDAMTSDEDRAMAEEFIEDIREGRLDDLVESIDPAIREGAEAQFEEARGLFPEREGETRILSYSVNSNFDDRESRTTKQFRLVTTDEEHWTITAINTLAIDGEQTIVRWDVEGFDDAPEELETMENIGTVLLWSSIVGIAFVVGLIALIVWLVRRSRRRSRDIGPQRRGDIGPADRPDIGPARRDGE